MGIPFAVPEHPWRLGLNLLQPPSCGRALVGCPKTVAPMIVPSSPTDKGFAHHLRRSSQASPYCDHLRGVCRDHAPWSDYFLLLRQRLGGCQGVAILPVEWYYGLHGPVVPSVGAAPVW